jgi:hypothetical protein
MSDDRRQRDGTPPTVALAAIEQLPGWLQTAIQVIGLVLIVGGFGALLVVEVFREMPWVYGLYCGMAVLFGFVLVVPALGVWFFVLALRLIPDALAKFLPSKLTGAAERVADRRGTGGEP